MSHPPPPSNCNQGEDYIQTIANIATIATDALAYDEIRILRSALNTILFLCEKPHTDGCPLTKDGL